MADPYDPLANTISNRVQILDNLATGVRVDPSASSQVDLDAATGQSEFVKGLRRAGYSMSATGRAFAGQVVEPFAPKAAQAQFRDARNIVEGMPESVRPKVQSYDQVDGLRSGFDYATGKLGEGIPSTVATLAGALIGRGVGRLGGASTLGSRIGGLGTALPMEAGETAMSLQADPNALANTTAAERLALSLGRGGVNAALENVVPQAMAGRITGAAARIQPGIRAAGQNTLQAFGRGARDEALTEAAQEFTGQLAQNYANPEAGFDTNQLIEAGISGGLAGGPLSALSSIPEAAYSNLGRDANNDSLKMRADKWIIRNIPAEERQQFAQAAGVLSQGTAAQRKILSDAMASGDGEQIRKAFGAAAGATANDAGKMASAAGNWMSNAFTAMRNAWGQENAAGQPANAKASAVIYSLRDRRDLRDSLEQIDPKFGEMFAGMDKSERRVLEDGLFHALDNAAWYANAPKGSMQDQFRQAWQEQTGTDFVDTLRALGQSDKRFAAAFEPQDPRMGIRTSWDSVDAQKDIALAAMDAREARQTQTPDDMESGLSDDTAMVEDAEGNLGQMDKEVRSPFDLDAVREVMSERRFESTPTVPATVQAVTVDEDGNEVVDERITPTMIANVFGKKIRPTEFSSYKEGEVDDSKPFELKLNLMSLGKLPQLGRFQERFREAVGEYDESATPDERALSRASSALAELAANGVEIDPAAFGLEAGAPIKLKVSTDLQKISPDIVVNRTKSQYGGKDETETATLKDMQGGRYTTRRQLSRLQSLAGEDGSYAGAYRQIDIGAKAGNRVDRAIRKSVRDSLENALEYEFSLQEERLGRPLSKKEREAEVSRRLWENPDEVLRGQVGNIAEKLGSKVSRIEINEALASERDQIEEAYKAGDISEVELGTLADYYRQSEFIGQINKIRGRYKKGTPTFAMSKEDRDQIRQLNATAKAAEADYKRLIESRPELGELAVDPADGSARRDAIKQGNAFLEMMERVDKSQADYEGGVENLTQDKTQLVDEFQPYKQQLQERENTSALAADVRRAARGLPAENSVVTSRRDAARAERTQQLADLAREAGQDRPVPVAPEPVEPSRSARTEYEARRARREADRPAQDRLEMLRGSEGVGQIGAMERMVAQPSPEARPSPTAPRLPAATTPSTTPESDAFVAGQERRSEGLVNTVMDTIARAVTPERMEAIGKRLAERRGDFTINQLKQLREAYKSRMDELKQAPAAPSQRQSAEIGDAPALGSTFSNEAQQKFVDIVRKFVGDRIAVMFGENLASGVAATYTSRQDALTEVQNALREQSKKLRDLYNDRRKNPSAYVANGKDTYPGRVKELKAKIAELENAEKRIDQDQAVLGVIRVATGREAQGGLAEHEAFHGAFSFFFNAEERRILGTAFSRGLPARKLREQFKDNQAVLDSIANSPEEAAAYGFQLWLANSDLLATGPEVKSQFQKMKDFIRNMAGVQTYEERAQAILRELQSGRRAERGTTPVQRILDKDMTVRQRAQKMAGKLGNVMLDGYRYFLSASYDRIIAKGNPILSQIADAVYSPTGADGNQGGMLQRQRMEFKKWANTADNIFQGMSEEDLAALHKAKILSQRPTDPALAEKYDQVTELYSDLYEYQAAAGVVLGFKGTYYPMPWDPEKVSKDKDAFLTMLSKYAQNFETMKVTPLEVWQNITSYIDRGDELNNVMGKNNEPSSDSTRERYLDFISPQDRLAFMGEDPKSTAAHYVKQAVRQAEFVRSFGMNGNKLNDMKYEAKQTYGATDSDLELLQDFMDGALGNKEVGMSRELKDVYGALNVYQNYRLLPFSLFSSLVDPMGVAIRSNDIGAAWETFSYSMKNLFKEWKKDYTRDQWEQIAEDMGILENHGTTLNAHNLYDGITLRGKTKELNDALFKYNLLNGWIRNNTIMAVKVGQKFMHRAATGFFGQEQSARYLNELGLEASDVVMDEARGRILLTAEELTVSGMDPDKAKAVEQKLRNATDKFVRQALLNPSSAELPNWMSNPYLMPLAHLKQFVFAFNATIIKRVANEVDNGNYRPVLYAAAYVPAMIAADFLKDMVNGFGEEPPLKKDWGVVDYTWNGVQRSGFTGTGQFFLDAKEDVAHGGQGVESWMGPSLEQGRKFIQAASSEDDGKMWEWMVKSMPANAVYDNALL
jgi:hypothetical protein